MGEFEIVVTIDGETYTEKQLARFEYYRTLHVLHEMKRLGAEIKYEGKELTDEEINWIDPEKAENILLNLKTGMSEQESWGFSTGQSVMQSAGGRSTLQTTTRRRLILASLR